MAADAPQRSVAVVGAGITGLLIAHGLQKLGHKVTVYEKEAHLGERVREWTILIHWALPTFQKLLPDHIVADLHTAYGDPFYKYDKEDETLPFYNGETGEIAFAVPAKGARRVSRTRLRGLCMRGLDVRWNKQFKELQMDEAGGPVVISFQDGETAEVDLVVGSDGSSSAVRRWLVGEEAGAAKPSEMAICNGTVNYRDAAKAKFIKEPSPITMIAFASTGSALFALQDVKDPNDPMTWTYHFNSIWRGRTKLIEGDDAIDLVKEQMKDVCEPFRSGIQWIPSGEGTSLFISQLHYWKPVPWDNRRGRVTLAGDAAHPMLPSRGQGLNHALDDVGKFLAQFERLGEGVSLEEALKSYEAEVVERGAEAVQVSLDDAEKITKVKDIHETRHAQQGLQA